MEKLTEKEKKERKILDYFLVDKKEEIKDIGHGKDNKAEPDLFCYFKNGEKQWYEITTIHYRDRKGSKKDQPSVLQDKINHIFFEIRDRFDKKFKEKRGDGRRKYDVSEKVNLIIFDETDFSLPINAEGLFMDNGTPVMWATIYQQISYKIQQDKESFGCITGEIWIMGKIDGKIRKASAKNTDEVLSEI